VEFIHKNVQGGNLSNCFHELSDGGGPYIPAMFKHARPRPHEFRPLNEAAQVIEEYSPKEMPEEPWAHLYACLDWFIYWTQWVIPIAVYPEAMQQARKTLLPQDLIRTVDGR
jgi:hypothetical protein